ncbi:MAG: hypothetical protein QOE22_265 [Candidatus Parcubacteria bacterium]|jgi:hypothetical protein|nr:hypothetical protein [Candidatus Parcubacteria bacterium]
MAEVEEAPRPGRYPRPQTRQAEDRGTAKGAERITWVTAGAMLAVILPLEAVQVFLTLTLVMAPASMLPGFLEVCIFMYWFHHTKAFEGSHSLTKFLIVLMLCTEIIPFWNAVFWGMGAVMRMIYLVRREDRKARHRPGGQQLARNRVQQNAQSRATNSSLSGTGYVRDPESR